MLARQRQQAIEIDMRGQMSGETVEDRVDLAFVRARGGRPAERAHQRCALRIVGEQAMDVNAGYESAGGSRAIFAATPPVPPANVAVSNLTIGGATTGISGTVHASQYVVTCTYAVPAGAAPGAGNVVVSFLNPQGATVSYTLTGGLTIQ